ncbi:MAG TPA: MFS transporter [Stellaceae bacterium]|nr:MFS transporter [Stellaceae bacterium]
MSGSDPRRTALAVLVFCFVAGLLARGIPDSFSVFVVPLSRHFGWDRAEVVSIYSFYALTSGLIGPVVGRLFDRSGPRLVYALGFGLLGGSLSLAAFAQSLWQLQAAAGLGVGIAASCLGNVPNIALLSRWYGKRLVTAASVVFSGYGVGILVLVPLTQFLVERFGWQGAYHWLGAGLLVLLLPMLLLPWGAWRRGHPELFRGSEVQHDTAFASGVTLLQAMRHPGFWGLFATFFFTSVGMFAVAVEVVAYLRDVGFAPMEAATAWGFSGALLPIGMIAVSWLDGVIGRRPSVLLSYAVTLAGVAMLWLLSLHPSPWLLAGFVICFGSTLGSRGPLISATAMRLFRGRMAATIFGAITIGSGTGQAIGAWAGGLLHDWSGGYNWVIGFAVVSLLCGMMPFLTLRVLRETPPAAG